MTQFSLANLFGITIRESATDGSDFTNPDADYRRLFLGEDGNLHLKDSAGSVTDIGGGGTTEFGYFQFSPQLQPTSSATGTWSYQQFTAEDPYPYGGWAFSNNASGAQNDQVSYDIALNAGTWAIDYIVRRSTNTGIITIKVDGTSVGTIDTYVTPGGHIYTGSITGISIATTGAKTLQFIMATKNASSSGYYCQMFAFTFRQTA